MPLINGNVVISSIIINDFVYLLPVTVIIIVGEKSELILWTPYYYNAI